MTGTTSGQITLATCTDSDDTENFLTVPLTTDLQTLVDLFHSSTGHNHNGTGEGAPIGSSGYAAGSVMAAAFAAGATMVKLAELSGASASYDFTSIPQTYRHLMLVGIARSDTAATTTGLNYRQNNVSTATYYAERLLSSGTTVAGTEALATSSAVIGLITAASAAAARMGCVEILIPHYANATVIKPVTSKGTCNEGESTGIFRIFQYGAIEASASAISRITLFPSAGSFTADSFFSLLGLPL